MTFTQGVLTCFVITVLVLSGWLAWLIRTAPLGYLDADGMFCLGTPPTEDARQSTDALATGAVDRSFHEHTTSAGRAHDHG